MPDHGESKLRNRVHKAVFGVWPDSVAQSRLSRTAYDPVNVNAILQSMWDEAGRGDEFVPLKGDEHLRRGDLS